MRSEKSFLPGLAMLSNLHVPKAHFNLVSSWFTLRDCLHLPPRHASLPLIISYKQCIICVSSKRRLLQPSWGNILFHSPTRFTNTVSVQCLTAPVSGNGLNWEIIILAIWFPWTSHLQNNVSPPDGMKGQWVITLCHRGSNLDSRV